AMSAAFVPTFTRYLTTAGKTSAWRLTNLVITALAIITGTLVLLGIVFAEPLVTLIALAAALMGVLNSLHHFFIPALSPAMFNVVTIVFAFAVVPFMTRFGIEPIVAIAISTTLGGVAQLALQW